MLAGDEVARVCNRAGCRSGVADGDRRRSAFGNFSGIFHKKRDFLATKVTERGTESFGLIKNENTTSKY